MKTKKIITAKVLLLMSCVLAVICVININSERFNAVFLSNVEALADEQVSSGKSACYMQYTESDNSHCLICGKCEMVPGIGSQKGGYCKW